ncbi:hypothetical protein CPB84DRAFT_1757328 [Gymnopilus junonius]|uniref:Uncharacterized protein n=1 Tax=Gymnopilus junonius TaxID=109634 RepID=A0A9P5N6E1_GYMJU|nr:hypothetical protein CPB84DRAFT_1757328 [Gymnopilus junonius]
MPSVFKRACVPQPTAEDETERQSNIVPIEALPEPHKPYGFPAAVIGHQGLVYAPSGVYSHQGALSSPPGMVADNTVNYRSLQVEPAVEEEDEVVDQVSKQERQWRKWSEEVIPALISLPWSLWESDGLREINKLRDDGSCKGCQMVIFLKCLVSFFERIEKLVVLHALSLLTTSFKGLFPCAPTEPSLAVDLNVLDFAKELFVNAAPNITAWCKTLKDFWVHASSS